MTLPLPQLDTHNWSDLVDEGLDRITRRAPEWTDHNVHDPGIMLLELLAYKAEQTLYSANCVRAALLWNILRLVDPTSQALLTKKKGTEHELDEAQTAREAIQGIREAVHKALATHDLAVLAAQNGGTLDGIPHSQITSALPRQAVTPSDYEWLARNSPEFPAGATNDLDKVARARAIGEFDIRTPKIPAHGSVTVLIISNLSPFETSHDLCRQISSWFDGLRLIGTKVVVQSPEFIGVTVRVTVADTDSPSIDEVRDVVRQYLHPLTGGRRGSGCPFGFAQIRNGLFETLCYRFDSNQIVHCEIEPPFTKSWVLPKLESPDDDVHVVRESEVEGVPQ